MRIALFTPVSPVQSALVDHIEGVLPTLAERFDITVVTDGSYRPTHRMFTEANDQHIPWISYDDFGRGADAFDLVIYQLGDEPNIHGYMFDALHRYPGLIFLHDLVLQHAIMGLTLNRGDPGAYIAEMRYSYGEEGERLAEEVMAGRGESLFLRYPLVERVLDGSLAVVGYNEYLCSRVESICPDLPVRHIPHHFYLPDGFPAEFDSASFRRDLGLGSAAVVATFGLFNSQKRLDVALRAFRRLLRRRAEVVYLLVGAPSYYPELNARIQEMGLGNSVRLTGWLSPVEFVKHMHVADVAVQLRYPHVGGTPYTPTRLLGLGVPTLISDIEPLAELPSNAVVRIVPDRPNEEAMVFAAIDYLLQHRDVAEALAENGRQYVARERSVASIADKYVSLIQEVADNHLELQSRARARTRELRPGAAPYDRLIRVAGGALAELGVSSRADCLLGPVARAIYGLVSESR